MSGGVGPASGDDFFFLAKVFLFLAGHFPGFSLVGFRV